MVLNNSSDSTMHFKARLYHNHHLKTDIVMGSFETLKPMSDAAGIAIGVLFGGLASTNNAVCNIDFYDTRDDELVVTDSVISEKPLKINY